MKSVQWVILQWSRKTSSQRGNSTKNSSKTPSSRLSTLQIQAFQQTTLFKSHLETVGSTIWRVLTKKMPQLAVVHIILAHTTASIPPQRVSELPRHPKTVQWIQDYLVKAKNRTWLLEFSRTLTRRNLPRQRMTSVKKSSWSKKRLEKTTWEQMRNLSGMISIIQYQTFAGQKKGAAKEKAGETVSSISHKQENQIEERKGSSNRSNSRRGICHKPYNSRLMI